MISYLSIKNRLTIITVVIPCNIQLTLKIDKK